MNALNERVLEYGVRQPEGTPLSAKELLHLGSRAALDQALSRLARSGKLLKVDRGLYVLPIKSRFGTRAPSTEKVVSEVAKLRGETIVPNGAAAANALGLTTQVPMRSGFLTSGRSRQWKFGAQVVELKHAPNWQLTKAGQPAGEAVRALAWIGPAHAREALGRLKRQLPASVLREIAASRAALPEWLAKTISTELVANG
jgi:hypothetical protein